MNKDKIFNRLTHDMKQSNVTLPEGLTNKIMTRVRAVDIKEPVSQPASPRWLKPVCAFAVILCVLITSSILIIQKSSNTILVKFSIDILDARQVSLVGDFNGWDEQAVELKYKNGTWKTKLRLKPDRYQYMFLVDGERWIADPQSTEYVDDGYGKRNSIIDITRI